jgi:hypothetical protein
MSSQGGPRVLAPRPLEQQSKLHMGPCRGKTTTVTFGRRVLAGGKGLAWDDLVLHDLHDLQCLRVGDVISR